MKSVLLLGPLLILLAAVACGAANGGGGPTATMRAFMQAGEAKDVDRAYATFDAQETPRDEVEALVNDHVLFEHFQDLKVDRWMVYAPPDSHRGRLTGTLLYSSGHTGRFEANMRQEKDGWRLTRVNITVSREKLREYQPPATISTSGR